MRAGFPASALEPDGGRIGSWVFENANVGLARGLFWCFTIRFKPFRYKDCEVAPSMTIEWVTLPIRSWKDLKGIAIQGSYGDDGVEASFYVWEHNFGSTFRLDVLDRREARFRVRMGMTVAFTGYDGTDEDPAMEVQAEAWLPYEGLMVPSTLEERPIPIAEARLLSDAFANMSEYGTPRGEGRTFPPTP